MFRIHNCAPFEKLELAFRNQLAQTNGVLFRRPRSTSENRIALANRTIEGDLLMVRWHYSRGSGKWRVFFASIEYNTIFVVQNRVKIRVCVDGCSHFIIFKSFKTFKSLRFVWWRMLLRNPPVEWMTRLCSYYEHLVLPGKSILGQHNYIHSTLQVCGWLTRLCATRTVHRA